MDPLIYLQRLTGRKPYLWQRRLLFDFIGGKIPDILDVPIGLGKTSVMGIWLASRMLGSPVPRRLVYVVDRRPVVDQATTEAEFLAANLANIVEGGVAPNLAQELRSNLGLKNERLPISTLRGAFADNRLWLENAARSAIIVDTVDMVGSRMLFEAYGVKPCMRPVHAALIANDTLVVLDEAHLVPTFWELLRDVTRFHRPAPVPEMRFLALSATGSVRQSELVFRIHPGEESDEPPVKSRLDAPKRLLLLDTAHLAQSLADRAFALGKGGRRVLIYCDSRGQLAQVVARKLRQRSAKKWKNASTTVMVGARRGIECESLVGRRVPDADEWEIAPHPVLQRFLPAAASDPTEIPAFLVATSAGEVGVDLDGDHMVCDLVAWERMVQRLGKVNRPGRKEPALVDVFAAVPRKDVGGDVTKQLKILRAPFESPLWPVDEEGRRQAGPGALRNLQEDSQFAALISAATTPEPLRPQLTLPLVEAWAMTSVEHHPGRPKIEPWLRGWVEQVPQARIVWRSVLPVRKGEKPDERLLGEFFDAFPPHLTEVLETKAYDVAECLKARSVAVARLLGGLEANARYGTLKSLAAVMLNSRGGVVTPLLSLKDLKVVMPNDLAAKTIIVDARLGGLSPDGLLDNGAAEPPATLDGLGEGAPLWDEARLRTVGRRLRIVSPESEPLEGWVRDAGWPIELDDAREEVKEWRVERVFETLTEGDAARLRNAQGLSEHLAWAIEEADRVTSALGLNEEFRRVVRAGAALHDAGKDRELWQTAMGAPRIGRPFAKMDGRRADGRALGGYRHEFGSLRDAEEGLSEIADESLRELARHLIAAHHGSARPMIPPIDPADPPTLVEDRSRAAALRFARLQEEWGPWGLAWWESLLRAADWAASARLLATTNHGDSW